MLYFNTLPKIRTTDTKGNGITLTNIMARAEILQQLLSNPLMFYTYDVQEGDTPDIVATKYYGDPYRFWMVLFSNQILDPQWGWPLSSQQFTAYLNDKYTEAANGHPVLSYTQGTIYEYRKTVTTTDNITLQSTSQTYIIDQSDYLVLNTGSTQFTFPDGTTAVRTVTGQAVSIYQYEYEQNEAKRNIKLINSIYAPQFESQFKSLMGT